MRRIIIAVTSAVTFVGAGIGLAATANAAEPNTAPGGSHRLSTYVMWPGQTVTLIVTSMADDTTPAAELTQTINWGDGSPEQTVAGDVTEIPHVYKTLGNFYPRVTISDGSLSSQAGCQTPCAVTVWTPVAGFKLNQTSTFVGKAASVTHHTSDDVDTVQIWWGDGSSSTVKASIDQTTTTHAYVKAGAFPVTVSPVNEFGAGTARKVGTVTVKADATKPVAALTKPSRPTRAASWATLRGKATDTGSGVRAVELTAVEKRGTAWYYYTGTTWVKATSGSVALTGAKVLTATPAASGAWTLKVKGLSKGTVRFTYQAVDKAGNRTAATIVSQKLAS